MAQEVLVKVPASIENSLMELILENLPAIKDEIQIVKLDNQKVISIQKKYKKELLKIIKKAEKNAKYLEEVISINKLKYGINVKNYGIY
jgi:hypothetical protein